MIDTILEIVTSDVRVSYIAICFLVAYFIIVKQWKNAPRKLVYTHIAIIVWSGGIHWAAFVGGTIDPQFGYYADWIVSTPLLIYSITITATKGDFTDDGMKALVFQVFVVITGILTVTTSYPMIAFAVGSVGLALVFYYLLQVDGIKENAVLTWILVGTWVSYPAVWWVTGGDLLEAEIALLIIPIISKHLFALIDLYSY